MKKFVLVFVLVLCVVWGSACAEMYPELYKVIEVNLEADTVVLVSGNGSLWIWEGAEDWEVDDLAAGIVEDWDTEDLFDDEILTLRYCANWGEAMH